MEKYDKKWEKLIKNYELHCKRIEKCTSVDITETPEQKTARIKRLEKSYPDWFEYYFKNYAKYKCAWYHKKAAKTMIGERVIYLIFEAFRGAAKSAHACVGIPLYLMLVKNDLKFMMLVGLNERKAKRLLNRIQAQLKFNQRIISDYGMLFKHGDWADGDFLTTTFVRFLALGLGQDPRGESQDENRPDLIVCSDIDNKKRSKNPTIIRERVEYITDDLWQAFEGGPNAKRRFILDNSRVHKNSILANLAKIFQNKVEAAKREEKPARHIHIRVPRVNEKGEPNWPERETIADIEAEKAETTSRTWAGEQMLNPIEDGKVFKRSDLGYKKILALEDYEALAIYGDLSYKNAGDFKAMKFWGKIGREYHLIDCFVRQASRREAAIWLYDLYEDLKNRTNRLNITCKFEGLFAQDEFVNEFDEEGEQRKWWIDIVPDKRPKEAKYDRIESTSGKYERHRVFYNIDKKDSPDFIESEDQLFAFEKGSGAPDDSPDADHGAFDLLDREAFVDSFEPRISPIVKKRSY
jgi:hypothetical protein